MNCKVIHIFHRIKNANWIFIYVLILKFEYVLWASMQILWNTPFTLRDIDTYFMNSEWRIFLSHIMCDAGWGFVTLLQWRARTGAGRLDGVGWGGGPKKTNVAPKLGVGVAPAYSRSAVQGFHLYDAIISLGFYFPDCSGNWIWRRYFWETVPMRSALNNTFNNTNMADSGTEILDAECKNMERNTTPSNIQMFKYGYIQLPLCKLQI